jgi:hypothetical protein
MSLAGQKRGKWPKLARLGKRHNCLYNQRTAEVAELADAQDLGNVQGHSAALRTKTQQSQNRLCLCGFREIGLPQHRAPKRSKTKSEPTPLPTPVHHNAAAPKRSTHLTRECGKGLPVWNALAYAPLIASSGLSGATSE